MNDAPARDTTAHAADRIGPARGLVLAHTARGSQLAAHDIARWLRLNRVVFKCDKVDLRMRGWDARLFAEARGAASELDLELSLYTDCSGRVPDVQSLLEAKPWDVLLEPAALDSQFRAWFDACRGAGVDLRVQLTAPFDADADYDGLVGTLSTAAAVNVAMVNPFATTPPARNGVHSETSVRIACALAEKLTARGVEVNLIGLPFCIAPRTLWPNVVDTPQFFLDHQQYRRESFELAVALFRRNAAWIKQIILMRLGQSTSTNNPIDRILLPWLMDYPWVRARVWAFHKLTRHRRSAQPTSPADAERELERHSASKRSAYGPVCAECSLRRICDGPARIEKRLPELTIVAQPGDELLDPLAFARDRTKHYDALDARRRERAQIDAELARRANEIVTHRPPAREVDSFSYRVDGTWSWPLPGSLRWFSFVGGEKVSTPLARLDPPFTLSVTFGGGVAEYIGFAIGRACRLMCPMTAFTHRVVLHVEEDGRYVLLRDGRAVQPVEFVGAYYAPARIGKGLEPRIAVWNIDGTIGTQAVYLWERETPAPPTRTFRVSIVIVCTRYSRRLQACLHNIAHQTGIPLNEIEVIVAFVPGLDATNDVLDSIQLAYPDLTLVPAPFAEEFANTKGLMLNECLDKARGEWVMVLDADILIAPDMLARLDALPDETVFAIPDGRKMLTRQDTARVLLGDIRPWESWPELLASSGEYRMREADGVPVGYCQCVRRRCLEKVRYEELHHFEGADWKFGKDMRDTFGPEHRISGMPVLHLDHGSSNWYGASRHY